MLQSFTIDDDLNAQAQGAIEVTLHWKDGERRWCFFMTPPALAACGDLVAGTNLRFHYGAPHMIVVSGPLDRSVIERVLRQLESQGELKRCSRPLRDETGIGIESIWRRERT